jgi:hypothetical protein
MPHNPSSANKSPGAAGADAVAAGAVAAGAAGEAAGAVAAAEAAVARPGVSAAGANPKSLVDAGYRAGSCQRPGPPVLLAAPRMLTTRRGSRRRSRGTDRVAITI